MRGATLDLINDIYIAGNGRVYKSIDDGVSFINHNFTSSSNKILTFDYKIMVCATGTTNGGVWIYVDSTLIPVELTAFNANVNGKNVELTWSTATELNNNGFEIERADIDKVFEKIGFVPGFGTSSESHFYSFVDGDINSGTYLYRLKQIDFSGKYEYSKEINVEVIHPLEFTLEQNYPNPFNPSTTINYEIAEQRLVNLKVFDILGNEVAVLVNEEKNTGSYEVDFDATGLSSGIYFYKLQAGDFVQTKKMILLR